MIKSIYMDLKNLIETTGKSCEIQGLSGSAKAWFFHKWQNVYKKPILVITRGFHEAESWLADLKTFCSSNAAVFPEWDDGGTLGSLDLAGERWSVLEKIPDCLIVPISSFKHKVISPDKLSEVRFKLQKGINIGMKNLFEWLVGAGYDSVDVVDLKGEFSHRGGLVDIFPPNGENPIRVEFMGDVIESIRYYNPQTQCSLSELQSYLYIYPADELAVYNRFSNQLVSIENYLSQDTFLILDEPGDLSDVNFDLT